MAFDAFAANGRTPQEPYTVIYMAADEWTVAACENLFSVKPRVIGEKTVSSFNPADAVLPEDCAIVVVVDMRTRDLEAIYQFGRDIHPHEAMDRIEAMMEKKGLGCPWGVDAPLFDSLSYSVVLGKLQFVETSQGGISIVHPLTKAIYTYDTPRQPVAVKPFDPMFVAELIESGTDPARNYNPR